MEYKYFQFPLCLMMETYKNREKGLNLMIAFGLVHFALKQQYDITDVARQVVYAYYRNRNKLPDDICKALSVAESTDQFTWDDEYECFSNDGQFEAEENIKEVGLLFEGNHDLRDKAIQHYRLQQAIEFFNVQPEPVATLIHWHNEAREIQNEFELKFGPDAMPSVKASLLYEFRENPQQDINILRAFIGIMSMIGQRTFVSTNKPAILSRMIGAKSKTAFEQLSKQELFTETLSLYTKRYNMDRFLQRLAEQKFIMFLSKRGTSVIYVSRYMEPEELAEKVRESRYKNNIRKRIKDAAASL